MKKIDVKNILKETAAMSRRSLGVMAEKSGFNKWPLEKKRKAALVGLLILFIFPFWFKGCDILGKKAGVQARPVETVVAMKKNVPIYLDSFGQMSSVADVDICSQVTGKILEVSFVQGDAVKKGDLLFQIDPAPYKAQFDKAKALLEQDTALLRLKSDTLERNRQLYDKELISKQEFEGYQTDFEAAQATVELDKAEVQAAQINLEYCKITSPLDGIASKRFVDPGNIVSANAGPVLVNIRAVDELYVDFTLAERYLASVREAMVKGVLEVRVFVPGNEDSFVTGKLDLVDNTVNEKTGTFLLRASMDNGDRLLWPGQFVTVRLILGEEKDAVLVSYDATKIGQKGYFAFVVDKNNKADLRQIAVGSRQGEDIVIEKGIASGEIVVTSGQMALRPGTPVIDVSKKVPGSSAKGKK